MPAAPSSPIDPTIGYLLTAVGSVDADRATILSVLAAVADPRARRGIRHGLPTILTVAVCAVLAGARSFVAIAEWVADIDVEAREQLGIADAVPDTSSLYVNTLLPMTIAVLASRREYGSPAAKGGLFLYFFTPTIFSSECSTAFARS
jgi:DDE family transposase